MDINQIMKERRTFRRFQQSKPVSDEIIHDICEAARLSSSAMNRQRLRFVVVKDLEAVEAMFPFTHFAAKLPKALGTPKEGEHPVLYILVLMPQKADPYLYTDAGIAMANMTTTAYTYGVGSCILGNIEREKIAELFDISEQIAFAIAFGYPAHKVTLVEQKESNAYYLDENKDYCVPKMALKDIVRII